MFRSGISIAFFIFISCSSLLSQNYRTVDPSRIAFYERQQSLPGEKYLYSVRIDSSRLSGNDSILFNFRTFNRDNLNNSCYGLDIKDTNPLFNYSIIKNNGDNVFLNKQLDSIKIKTSASLNSSWALYNFSNGDYIKATITAISQQTILSSPDSVKIISLQAYNSSNSPIANDFNGKEIRIGKANGFVLFFATQNFPNDTVSYRLVGKSNPNVGVTKLTPQQVFDLNVGDLFQYQGGYNSIGNAYNYYEEKKVLSKYTSTNLDTVVYTYDHKVYQEWYDYTSNPPWTYQFTRDTSSSQHIFSALTQFNNLSYEFVFQPPNYYADPYQHNNSSYPSYNGRMQKSFEPYYYSGSGSDTCVEELVGWCIYGINTYADGLGWVSTLDNTYIGCENDYLVYYKKGSETWGTPLDWSTILGTNESSAPLSLSFSIYPNPVTDEFTISLSMPFSKPSDAILYDPQGKIVKRIIVPANQSKVPVSVTGLSQGVYFLSIQTPDANFISKIIK